MRKITLLLLLSALFLAGNASAAYLGACLSTTNLGALLGNSCQSQDKLFTFNSYSIAGDAAQVTASLVFQNAGGVDEHGWAFTRPIEGPWTGVNFTLSLTIDVCNAGTGPAVCVTDVPTGRVVNPANAPVYIQASLDQINTAFIPDGVTDSDLQTQLGGSPANQTLTTNGASTGAETMQVPWTGNVREIASVSTLTIPAGQGLSSLEQDWFQTATNQTPEPVSFLLIGGGLLALGVLKSRRSSRSS